ncbi:AraC family transcriptional regulator [Mameliella sediminis]|uniref:AraC family transcriptional regulator n=1 Tax=Mameliella sediminis TaxID=2836866 RepID=UPI001C45CFD8|nr:AraC family transcriptional regulator [Mameliella sediminis]MBV7395902.1 AraC family transcriptional regulator [Mameliella sediminis]
MSKSAIRQIIETRTPRDGLIDTGIAGVQLFRATEAVPCAPAVYDPCVVAIVSGGKEAVLDGNRHVYGSREYLCCPMSMPVEAGTPSASPDNPLLGVYIALDPRLMTELTLEMATVGDPQPRPEGKARGIRLATWDAGFADGLLRLLHLLDSPTDMAILGMSRLREVYYAILKGEAGAFARHSFGPGNAIARAIAHVSANLADPASIEDLAARAGMSRAVFHRKFKQATTMSPIQFVKSMRLNKAAMKIASGMTVSEAARQVGYVSASQFSREFKRMYGNAPRRWSDAQQPASLGP